MLHTNRFKMFGAWVLSLAFAAVAFAQAPARPASSNPWKTVADAPYLQEVGEKIATEHPVTQVTVHDGWLFGVLNGSLVRLEGSTLQPVSSAPIGITRLKTLDGALWISSQDGTYRGSGSSLEKVSDWAVADFCIHLGAVHAATRDAIFRYENGSFVDIRPKTGYLANDTTVMMADGSQVLVDPVEIAPIQRIGSYSDTLYLLRHDSLALLEGDKFVTDPIDWGTLPSPNVRDMMVQGSRVFITTDRGVGVVRGMALSTLRGADGLPYEDTTCLASGFDGDLWIGTATGAIRKTETGYHYFGAQHWLPSDRVNSIAVGDHVVYIATDAGLGILRYEPYTLAKKAAYFERALEEWGQKRLGFIHQLYWSDKDNEWLREVSDNDGGNTAHYLAAMSFKYAATKDPAAKREADEAFQAMAWLESITGSDGFFGRSVWALGVDKGEPSRFGSGGLPAKWYKTADGKWMWKGDTSSDETNGHYFAVSLYHDLVADEAGKKQSARHLARITSHIMKNGWLLRDMDGQPTRWGRWDPEYLQRPYGFESRGLNSLEAQTYVWTALKLTGDQKFRDGLNQLIAWGYPDYTLRQKITFPPENVITWDDELAFWCYHAILSYADDPKLRSIYLRSLTRSWEVMRMQKLPFYNFVYGAFTGNDCEVEASAQHLREWSLDIVNHSFRNSHRADLAPEPGYPPIVGDKRAMSPRETTAMWGSRPAIEYDGGNGGRTVTPPIGWLEDYWMGRYYGFIEAPDTKDPTLTTIPDTPIVQRGAKPYDGPPRPAPVVSANDVSHEGVASAGFVLSDGLRIHYESFGQGPPLILVCGWGADTQNWIDTGWVDALQSSRRVISLEPRGHGESDKPHDAAAYSYSVMARDVIALMDQLHIAKADFMGYSMGAFIGAYLLGHHADRFDRGVLGGIGDATEESKNASLVIAAALRAPDAEHVTDPLGRAYRAYVTANPRNDLEAMAVSALQMWPEEYPLELGGEGLRRAANRVLVVNGADDHPYVDSAGHLAGALKNARIVTIPGADHLSAVSHPKFKEAVIEFLAGR